jgi:hypothetical protein
MKSETIFKRRAFIVGLAIVSQALISSVPVSGSDVAAADSRVSEFQEQITRIIAAGQALNLDELERIGEQVERDYEKWRGDHYYRLMCAVSATIGTYSLGHPKRESVLERRYATLAIEKPDPVPLDVEVHLLLRLQGDVEYQRGLRGQAWADFRAERVRRWKQVWDRLDTVISSFAPKAYHASGFVNHPLPEGVSGFTGMPPDRIKDPQKRAEYEAILAEDLKASKAYQQHGEWQQLDGMLSPVLEKYITTVYSRPPFRVEELRDILGVQASGEPQRPRLQQRSAQILESVEKVIVLPTSSRPAVPETSPASAPAP